MAQAGTGSLADEDWDDLRFVLAVAEEGTVSAAARRLAVNHATVLRRIARFEDRHGMVFDKTPRGYSLAQGRQDLVSAARDVDRAVMGVSRILAGARLPLTGEVRVTSTDSLCVHLLPAMVAQIVADLPGLAVTLVSSNAHLDLARIEAGDPQGHGIARRHSELLCFAGLRDVAVECRQGPFLLGQEALLQQLADDALDRFRQAPLAFASIGLARHQIRHEAATLLGAADQDINLPPRQAKRLRCDIGSVMADHFERSQWPDDFRSMPGLCPRLVGQGGHPVLGDR